MTGHSASSWTLPAPSSHTIYPVDTATSKDATVEVKTEKIEDSIQCICNYAGDDGNTIFCEDCKTWQHIACYYPGQEKQALEEEFQHSCADCEPRQLDRAGAIQRLYSKIGMQTHGCESHDKKSKKIPSSKPHKRKMTNKPNELQLNGHSPADGPKHGSPPPKKPKPSHRSSHSVSAHTSKRSPSHSAPKANHHGHPLSPATTPPDVPQDYEGSAYPTRFLSVHEDSVEIVDSNTIATLMTTNLMSSWSRPDGAETFRQHTGAEFDEVVRRNTPSPLYPPLRVETKELPIARNSTLTLRYLVTPSPIDPDVPMMELNGVVGLQKDYCDDSNNRYKELSAPLPFVFFPSNIPLYIDTRQEGSNARHVRRSCRPNARLLTYLSDESGWHFWLVSDRAIHSNEEITVGWDISLLPPYGARLERLLDVGDEASDEQSVAELVADMEQSEYDALSHSITSITSEYGGCACELEGNCAFSRFHRQYQETAHQRSIAPKRKRAKPKPHTISPSSTSQATNSRAASEGHGDEMHDHDDHSSATSSRSKAPSRDRTPVRLGSFDTLGILTEPTNRDKRKVQIAEDLFQKSAQEEQLPRKKKKTADASTTHSTSSRSKKRDSTSQTSEKSNGFDERRYTDAAAPTSKATSPESVASRSQIGMTANTALRRPSSVSISRLSQSSPARNYCDAASQTESTNVAGVLTQRPGPSPRHPARPQKKVISLTMRLLMHKREHSTSVAQQSQPSSTKQVASAVTLKSPQGSPGSVHKKLPMASSTSIVQEDAAMLTADSTAQPADETSSQLSQDVESTSPIKTKSPELRVQMPPVPVFTNHASSTSTNDTPSSTTGSILYSPLSSTALMSPFAPLAVNGVAGAPSPVKKKMSLSEYKNKANKAAASASAKAATDLPHPLKTASVLAQTMAPSTNGNGEAKTPADAIDAAEATQPKEANTAVTAA
ncbi:hypothetical protein BD289DRAFT_360195 [Coniella lustricola]|uniref:SET domain-containing protein n=1 Tax=Coniella lustricola TaxID=2025994 RepID=A0A2T3AK98_9PEZI|nr:hypothetical protein BD289DRAFT_360195 [Coniella lustricola]